MMAEIEINVFYCFLEEYTIFAQQYCSFPHILCHLQYCKFYEMMKNQSLALINFVQYY